MTVYQWMVILALANIGLALWRITRVLAHVGLAILAVKKE